MAYVVIKIIQTDRYTYELTKKENEDEVRALLTKNADYVNLEKEYDKAHVSVLISSNPPEGVSCRLYWVKKLNLLTVIFRKNRIDTIYYYNANLEKIECPSPYEWQFACDWDRYGWELYDKLKREYVTMFAVI